MLYFQIVHTMYTHFRYTKNQQETAKKIFFFYLSFYPPFCNRTHGCPPIRAFDYLKVNLGKYNAHNVDKK